MPMAARPFSLDRQTCCRAWSRLDDEPNRVGSGECKHAVGWLQRRAESGCPPCASQLWTTRPVAWEGPARCPQPSTVDNPPPQQA